MICDFQTQAFQSGSYREEMEGRRAAPPQLIPYCCPCIDVTHEHFKQLFLPGHSWSTVPLAGHLNVAVAALIPASLLGCGTLRLIGRIWF